ncbi:alpha/beta hydrolase family protein [Methylobacterium sp. NPDC080182]|uniref:alpha/beta hydrolase family protein n=1 Tax=Methylobacterium sp. NPDC080182 TaxID=3390590 RepID=UPI003CFBFEE3
MIVGFRSGLCLDPSRSNWEGTSARPISWSAWYPAADVSVASHPNGASWFKLRPVVLDAQPLRSRQPRPLMLLSHGSGASALAMDWLGHRLAESGFVAVGIDHHGHTGTQTYRAEGFLCLWERARDVTALLDDSSWRGDLGVAVEDRACVVGFSAGAYTAMLLAGARVAYSQFEPDNPVKSPIRGPREFPQLADEVLRLQASAVFRASWERRRDDYRDERVRCAVAIAPGRSVLGFSEESLRAITRPVLLIGGDADTTAPPDLCCQAIQARVATSTFEMIRGGVNHYTFLPEGSDRGQEAAPELFEDTSGLDRKSVHDRVAAMAAEFDEHVRS